MLRQPAVADRFYPGSARALKQTVSELLAGADINKRQALAVVSPHAGYIYSGELAGRTIGSTIIPETVIILGPNHHGHGASVAVSMSSWNMPQGVVSIDTDIAEALMAASIHITADEKAHSHEHSLEVQIPFLQETQPDLQLVPIVVSHISYSLCEDVAQAIATTIKKSDKDILILASTDMTHFESRMLATEKDKLALQKITALDPEGLYRTVINKGISMCGFIPVTIALKAAKLLGATKAHLVGYTDSGNVSGDTDQVVGYAGLIIS